MITEGIISINNFLSALNKAMDEIIVASIAKGNCHIPKMVTYSRKLFLFSILAIVSGGYFTLM